MGRQSLRDLICLAYSVEPFQISGALEWVDSARFDVQAKLPEGASPSQVPEMLQSMLEERFKLTLHRDAKQFSVYVLTVGKDGLKIKRPPGNDPDASRSATRPSFDNITRLLSSALETPVMDETGLRGEYALPTGDLLMSFMRLPAVLERMGPAASARADAASAGPDPFAVIGSWGLKLEPRKITLPVPIIDHVEKTPTDN